MAGGLVRSVVPLLMALKELRNTNPWPERHVLANALQTLATELWDRCLSAKESTAAFQAAIDDLPPL